MISLHVLNVNILKRWLVNIDNNADKVNNLHCFYLILQNEGFKSSDLQHSLRL